MVGEESDIGFATFDFPSDKLTVRELRRLHPEQLDRREPEWATHDNSLYAKLSELIFCERVFASNTYDQARGQYREGGIYEEDLELVREELAGVYIKFGLASGKVHAEELVRSVEREALQQAARHGGQGR
jgi:hypothetical protein